MSDGGNSQQRKKAKKAQERMANDLADKIAKRLEPKSTTSEESPKTEAVTLRTRLSGFWGSTPVWGGIGILVGAIASQVSLKLLFAAVWGIFLFEFVRVGFFARRFGRVVGNFVTGVILALGFIALWRITPKPKDPATLDQQMDALAHKFPFLTAPPPRPIINIPANPQTRSAILQIKGIVPTITPQVFLPGYPAMFNIYVRNTGTEPAQHAKQFHNLYLVDDASDATQKRLVREFKTFVRQ